MSVPADYACKICAARTEREHLLRIFSRGDEFRICVDCLTAVLAAVDSLPEIPDNEVPK